MDPSIYPLTLLYDRACPVCRLEMDGLRGRTGAQELLFVDISAPGFDPRPYGASVAAMQAEIHAVRADGQLVVGVEVLRLAYAAAGAGWLLRPTAWPGLRPVADGLYRVFARHRYAVSRWTAPLIEAVAARRAVRRMGACRGGRCDVPDRGSRS